MVITRLEEMEKSKVKVYLDDSYAFLLYQKDIKHLGIEEGDAITEEVYEKILADIIFVRAKQKALEVLKFMDRTEQELSKKLSDAGYPQEIIHQTIDYVKEYGYIDDTRFTSSYVRTRMHAKSKLVIKTELLRKGISKGVIDKVFHDEYEIDKNSDSYEDAEMVAIKRNIAKKTKSPNDLTVEEKRKLMASLYRKGFDIDKIKKAIY